MHFSSWITEIEDSTYINPAPCRYQSLPARPLPTCTIEQQSHRKQALATAHPLSTHPWWQARPHLLNVLFSLSPYETAQSLLSPHCRTEALYMLHQRSLRIHNMLNLHRGCQRTDRNAYPNLEWDIFRALAPKFLNGELKFAQINWHAIGFKDKLRFEEEVDRGCAVKNAEIDVLRARVVELEAMSGLASGDEGLWVRSV